MLCGVLVGVWVLGAAVGPDAPPPPALLDDAAPAQAEEPAAEELEGDDEADGASGDPDADEEGATGGDDEDDDRPAVDPGSPQRGRGVGDGDRGSAPPPAGDEGRGRGASDDPVLVDDIDPLKVLGLYGAGAGFSCAGSAVSLPSPLCVLFPPSILPGILAYLGVCALLPLGQGMAVAALARVLLGETPDFLWTTVASYVACWGLAPFATLLAGVLLLVFLNGYQNLTTGVGWPYAPIPQQPPQVMLGLGVLAPPAVTVLFALAQPIAPAVVALLTSANARAGAREQVSPPGDEGDRDVEALSARRAVARPPTAMAF